MLSGLQTNAAWSPADFGLIRPRLDEPPQFQSAKLYQIAGCKHDEADVLALIEAGITHFTLRLSDSIYQPDAQHAFQWQRDPVGYAEDCLRVINRFVKVGVYDFVVDNEANIVWARMGYTSNEYAAYMRIFIEHIRARHLRDGWDLPGNARLFAPPIAWTDEYPHMPWLGALHDVISLFDGVAVHSYWQSSRQGRTLILQGPLRSQRFGANYEYYQTVWPGMPIQITEWGNSIHEQGQWTPAQVEAFRIEQYPIWLQFAEEAGIEAAHVFISQGATQDWNGFKISPNLASVMSHSLIKGGDSLRLSGGRNLI